MENSWWSNIIGSLGCAIVGGIYLFGIPAAVVAGIALGLGFARGLMDALANWW